MESDPAIYQGGPEPWLRSGASRSRSRVSLWRGDQCILTRVGALRRSPESVKSIPRYPEGGFRAHQLLAQHRGSSSTESIPELMPAVRRSVSESTTELPPLAHPVSYSQLSGSPEMTPSRRR